MGEEEVKALETALAKHDEVLEPKLKEQIKNRIKDLKDEIKKNKATASNLTDAVDAADKAMEKNLDSDSLAEGDGLRRAFKALGKGIKKAIKFGKEWLSDEENAKMVTDKLSPLMEKAKKELLKVGKEKVAEVFPLFDDIVEAVENAQEAKDDINTELEKADKALKA